MLLFVQQIFIHQTWVFLNNQSRFFHEKQLFFTNTLLHFLLE